MNEEKAKKMNDLMRTLKNSGLAAGTDEATKMAAQMLGKENPVEEKPEIKEETSPGGVAEEKGIDTEPEEKKFKDEEQVKESVVEETDIKEETVTEEKQTDLTNVKETILTIDEIEEVPKQNRKSEDYDVTKETKTLKELMDEDAEQIYNEEKKEENA